MKIIFLGLIPVLLSTLYFTGVFNSSPTNTTKAVELTDIKGIPFAYHLRDWQQHRVDSLALDIYYPTGATSDKKYPVVIFCHAGGFNGGDRSNVSSICDELADFGYICVAPDYRTGYNKNQPHQCTADTTTMGNAIYMAMQDADACLRWVGVYGSHYNMDTSKLFYGGSSAGATLSLYSAYANDSLARIFFPREKAIFGSLDSSGNTLPKLYNIKGICAMWGCLFSDKVIDTNYRAFPTIMFKGDEDSGLPDSVGHFWGCTNYPAVYAGAGIYARMVLEKTPVVYYELPQAGHPAYDDDFCIQNMACFFNNIIKGTPYSGHYQYFTPSCPQYNGE